MVIAYANRLRNFFMMKRYIISAIFIPSIFLLVSSETSAETYTPPGYSAGYRAEGWGWDIDLGMKQYEDDYYLAITPRIQLELFKLRIGIQVPLEILAQDRDPKLDQKTGTLRKGTYDSKDDFAKIISYVAYGTHLFYDPDDLFDWSFHYGYMTDGYIGHKTIIYRFVSTHNPSENYRAGFMADINNRWGGVEVFRSDIMRNEVMAGRGYLRPIGILKTFHNVMFANSSFSENSSVALSIMENRNPDLNGGIFFQETATSGSSGFGEAIDSRFRGSLGQYLHNKIRDDVPMEDSGSERKGRKVEYKKVVDPRTGRERLIPVEEDPVANERGLSEQDRRTQLKNQDNRTPEERKKSKKWEPGFFNRWAIGYTQVRDISAPLSLEKDGSGHLVIDPDTGLPRGDKFENINIVGMDTEFRMSPFRWLELTPYADKNTIKNVSDSQGVHVGVDAGMKLGSFIKMVLRPEYREISSNYIPTYFDSYYVLERTAFNPGGSGQGSGTASTTSQTKLAYMRSMGSGGEKIKGGQLNAILDIVNLFVIELSYDDYDGPNNSQVFTGFYLPPLFGIVYLNGYYMKKNFDHYRESFVYDDRSLLAAEAGVILFGGFGVKGTLLRTWVYDTAISAYVIHDEKNLTFSYTSAF